MIFDDNKYDDKALVLEIDDSLTSATYFGGSKTPYTPTVMKSFKKLTN